MDTYALDEKIQARRGKRRRALLAILLSSSLATLGAGAMSLAVFTDSDASSGTWTAGSIDIVANPHVAFNVTGVMPGDSGSQTINILNNGGADLRYALTTSGSGALAPELQMAVKAGACPGAGADLDSGNADAIAFGDPAQGDDTGDRTLLAGANEDLCFAWTLPLGTSTTLQGASADITYTFDAEQTANNP